MKLNASTALQALVLAAGALAGTAHANLLANGSFESNNIGDGSYVVNAAPGWAGNYFVMDPDSSGGIPSAAPPWPQAFAGDQYADIGNGPAYGISQSFTVTNAGSYLVNWVDHTALGFSQPPWNSLYDVALTGPSTVPVATGLDAWQSSGNWGQRSFVVNLSAGNYTLAFKPQGGTSLDVLIDNVSVTAVPEPSTWILLLAGVGAVSSVARRRLG